MTFAVGSDVIARQAASPMLVAEIMNTLYG
jgi:hypothetical protein